jgi:hypothetical protein
MSGGIALHKNNGFMIQGGKVERVRATIVEILEDHGFLTVREIAECLRMRDALLTIEIEYALSRLTELQDAGMVVVTGKKISRWTGRYAWLWGIKTGGTSHDLSGNAGAFGSVGTKNRGAGRYGGPTAYD